MLHHFISNPSSRQLNLNMKFKEHKCVVASRPLRSDESQSWVEISAETDMYHQYRIGFQPIDTTSDLQNQY